MNEFYSRLTELLDNLINNNQSPEYYHPALINLTATGLSIFVTKEDFLHWMNSPSIDCQGKCPKDLMVNSSGIKALTFD